jgi:hypothetical protein
VTQDRDELIFGLIGSFRFLKVSLGGHELSASQSHTKISQEHD